MVLGNRFAADHTSSATDDGSILISVSSDGAASLPIPPISDNHASKGNDASAGPCIWRLVEGNGVQGGGSTSAIGEVASAALGEGPSDSNEGLANSTNNFSAGPPLNERLPGALGVDAIEPSGGSDTSSKHPLFSGPCRLSQKYGMADLNQATDPHYSGSPTVGPTLNVTAYTPAGIEAPEVSSTSSLRTAEAVSGLSTNPIGAIAVASSPVPATASPAAAGLIQSIPFLDSSAQLVADWSGLAIDGITLANGVATIDVNRLPGINITGSKDDTSLINTAISAIPAGNTINLEFGPGKFEVDGTIILPSNTNVMGESATIVTNASLVAASTQSQFQNQNFPDSAKNINSNISIRGLTFYYPRPLWNIAIWLQNVNNVEISGNTFLAANNGDIAVLNASNTVISGNVADGNINIAYNGWNGLSNIAVVNNSDYQSGSAAGSGGYFFNGTLYPPLGQTYNGGRFSGDQINNFLANNISAGALPGGTGFAAGTLGYGYTTNQFSTMQGNLYAANGTPSTFGFLDLGAGVDNTMLANIVSQYVAGNPEQTTAFASHGAGAGSLAAVGSAIIGNEVFGATGFFSEFQNLGDASTTSNDIVLAAQANAEFAASVGLENSGASGPVVSGVGGSVGFGTVANGPVATDLTISGTDNMIVPATIETPLPGVSVSGAMSMGDELLTLSISDFFGTVAADGQTGRTITLLGSLSQINAGLADLSFLSNAGGWNDEIHLSATDNMGHRAVWDVAIGVATSTGVGGHGIGTFSAINSTNQQPLQPLTNDPVPLALGGNTLVVQGGRHDVTMGGLVNMILTGDGSNTIIGGDTRGYIQTNTGPVFIDLQLGGDITVSGGVGGVDVSAAAGDDLIQSASGPIRAVLGSGADTVLAGVAGASVTGGSGSAIITTLPQFGGPLNVTLGSGGGIIYALSGDAVIATAAGARDIIYAGQGVVHLSSGGNDRIYAGSGEVSIVGGASASDTIFGGSGSMYFRAGSGPSYVAPGSGSTSILAGSGDLVVAPVGDVAVTIDNLQGSHRILALGQPGEVQFVEYNGNPIVSQTLAAGGLSISLTDGTQILMSDPLGAFATTDGGILESAGWSLTGSGSANLISGTASSTLVVDGPAMTLSGSLGPDSPAVLEVNLDSHVILDNLTGTSGLGRMTLSGNLLDVHGDLAIAGIDLNGGQFQIDPATVTSSEISGTGAVTIDNNTSLGVSGSVGTGVTIAFDGANGALGIGTLANLTGTLDGFSATDSIDFSAAGAITETFAADANGGGVLTVFEAGTSVGAATFGDGSFSSSSFVLTHLANGTDKIAVACFVAGTRVMTNCGWRVIDTLEIGDYITTYDGRSVPIKWMARKVITNGISREDHPVKIPRGCLGPNVPTADLYVSADHALLIGGLLVPAGLLCNGTISRVDPGSSLSYFHLETENHEVILAEGVPVETFIDVNNRSGFDNVDEYRAIYGTSLAPPVSECAPRTVAGELASSAILHAFGSKHFLGGNVPDGCQLRGHLDEATSTFVQGWARAGDATAIVEISVNGRVRGYVNACDFRRDLLDAGIGSGFAAFRFEFERSLPSYISNSVSARIVGSTFALDGSPARVAAAVDRPYEFSAVSLVCSAEAAVDSARARVKSRADCRPVALVVDDREPDPDRDAGSEAILSHTATLVTLGYRVIFVARQGIQSSRAADAIHLAGAEPVGAPGGRALESILDTVTISLAFIHRPIVAVSYAGLIKARSPRCTIVLSVADLEHLRVESLMRLLGERRYTEERATSIRRLDQAVRLVDQVITHSTSEKRWLMSHYHDLRVDVVLWHPTVQRVDVPFTRRAGAGFIGSMGHAPNLDAVFWIDKVIEPALRKKGAAFQMNMIGSEFPESIYLLERPGLVCTGAVPDLSSALGGLRTTVAPLRAGAGVKGKVLSSLQAGVPCIMTTIAADGLELPHELMAMVSDNAEGIAARIIAVHETPTIFAEVAEAGLAWADTHLKPTSIRSQMEAALFEPKRRSENVLSDQNENRWRGAHAAA